VHICTTGTEALHRSYGP